VHDHTTHEDLLKIGGRSAEAQQCRAAQRVGLQRPVNLI